MSWDDRLLFAPLHTLSARSRAAAITLCTVLTFAWVLLRDGRLGYVWTLPDAMFYVLMAKGRFDQVPAPFSARPLAPLLARALAALAHTAVEPAFIFLAYLSLLSTLAVVFLLAARTRAPRWTLLLLAAVPFWPQLLTYAGLPDPLYTGLLAALLLALETERLSVAAVLMLPLMLTRESTFLTLFCLFAVAWPRLRWPRILLALASAGVGVLLVHHLAATSLPNPEHLSGALYMAGKLLANTARSFGVLPWSNVYPELCNPPTWQHAFPLGPVRSIGICGFAPEAPSIVAGSLLTLFGAIFALAIALLAARRVRFLRASPLTQFCLLYGGLSALLAPSLGTWFDRLFGYAWPLFLVGMPRMLARLPGLIRTPHQHARSASLWGLFLVLHLILLGLSQTPIQMGTLALVAIFQATLIALLMVHFRRYAHPAPKA